MGHSIDNCARDMLLPGQGPLGHQAPRHQPAESTHGHASRPAGSTAGSVSSLVSGRQGHPRSYKEPVGQASSQHTNFKDLGAKHAIVK